MAKRDNAPKRRKTNAELPSNINELVDKYKTPRKAWLHEMQLLENRIKNAEKEHGIRVDIEQLPDHAKNYLLYGAIPNRADRYLIKEIKDIRDKQLRGMAVDQSFWETDDTDTQPVKNDAPAVQDTAPDPTDVMDYEDSDYNPNDYESNKSYKLNQRERIEIAEAEIDNLKAILNRHPNNPINIAMLEALDDAIARDGIEKVAQRISSAVDASQALAELAHKYRANSSQGHHHLAMFKAIITGKGITREENAMITGMDEEEDGEAYFTE